jgi:hypothetical protein
MRIRSAVPLLLVLLAACGGSPGDAEPGAYSGAVETSVHGLAVGHASTKTPSNLIDHLGPVLSTSNTYAIYWGPTSGFPADLEPGMTALLKGFVGSSYLGIASQYMRGAALTTSFGGNLTDTSQPPKSAPNAAALAAEVCKLVTTPDPNGVYFVFTSNAPNINYCAWHNKAACNGVTFEVAYVPNQADLPGCSPYTVSNLGCNAYSAGTVTSADSVAHEFMESISDPQINAWLDANKLEMADKCEYSYAACVNLPNGSSWQIQTEWSNAISGCQQQ